MAPSTAAATAAVASTFISSVIDDPTARSLAFTTPMTVAVEGGCCSCGRRGGSAQSGYERTPSKTSTNRCSLSSVGRDGAGRRPWRKRKNESMLLPAVPRTSTCGGVSPDRGATTYRLGVASRGSARKGRRKRNIALSATFTEPSITPPPSPTAADLDGLSSSERLSSDSIGTTPVRTGLILNDNGEKQVGRDGVDVAPETPQPPGLPLQRRGGERKNGKRTTTAQRLIAATASTNASAFATSERSSTEGDGQRTDEHLTGKLWNGAPRAESEELYNLNMQLAAYAKDAQWDMAISLLKQMRTRSDSTGSLSPQQGMANADSSDENQGSVENQRNADIRTKAEGGGAQAVEGDKDSIERKAGLMRRSGAEPNVVSYNNVISACANAKKQKRAEGIFREMTKDRGLRPNVFTYGALISACAKRGNWEDSVKYLEGMREAGLAPNAIIYSTVISACERSDQWQRAVSLLRAMRQDGILPVTVTYNTVISACGKNGQWQMAVSLLDEMLELGAPPDMVTFASAMLACDRARQWHQVLRIMDQMEEEGVVMDKYAYTTAIHAAGQLGKWARSIRYLDDMAAHGVQKDVVTVSAAINACAAKGQWAQAEKLLQDMLDSGLTPNVVTYTTMMVVLRKGGQYEKAIGILDLMRSEGVRPNVRTYSVAIAACADAKEWRRALGLMKEMQKAGVNPNTVTYNTAIRACGNAGALQEGLGLMNEMGEKGVKLTVVTYGSAIAACQRQGEWEMALELLATMRRDQIEPNEIVYMGVIKTCCAGGKPQKALELLSRMMDLRMRPTTHCFNAVIKALAETDHLQEATRVLTMLKSRRNCTVNVQSYTPIVEALTRQLRWQEAIMLFQEMENRKITPTVQSYTSVVRACERAGQYDTALKLLDEMRKRRMRFYDIGILDELFKRLLSAVALLRGQRTSLGRRAPSSRSSDTKVVGTIATDYERSGDGRGRARQVGREGSIGDDNGRADGELAGAEGRREGGESSETSRR